jgi:hypothetical protein
MIDEYGDEEIPDEHIVAAGLALDVLVRHARTGVIPTVSNLWELTLSTINDQQSRDLVLAVAVQRMAQNQVEKGYI